MDETERIRIEQAVREEFGEGHRVAFYEAKGVVTIEIRNSLGEPITREYPVRSWDDFRRMPYVELCSWLRALVSNTR
jgi:hypothetical protein